MNSFRKNTGVVVLLSGGVDSTVIAELAHRKGKLKGCVFVAYNQAAQQEELHAALNWCTWKGYRLDVARLDLPVVRMNTGAGEAGSRYVPMRNTAMLSIAVAHAVELGANQVHYGAIKDDEADYFDCRKSFIMDLNRIAMDGEGVEVKAPLINKTKAEVLALAKALGIELHRCWSCYEPKGGHPCGTCDSCVLRGMG